MKKHRLFFIIASIIFIAFYLFDHFAYEYYVFFSNFYRFTVFSRPLILIALWCDHLFLVFKRK